MCERESHHHLPLFSLAPQRRRSGALTITPKDFSTPALPLLLTSHEFSPCSLLPIQYPLLCAQMGQSLSALQRRSSPRALTSSASTVYAGATHAIDIDGDSNFPASPIRLGDFATTTRWPCNPLEIAADEWLDEVLASRSLSFEQQLREFAPDKRCAVMDAARRWLRGWKHSRANSCGATRCCCARGMWKRRASSGSWKLCSAAFELGTEEPRSCSSYTV